MNLDPPGWKSVALHIVFFLDECDDQWTNLRVVL